MYEIYTLGNLDFLVDVLNGIALLMDTDEIGSGRFIAIGFMISVFIAGFKAIMTGKFEINHILMSWVIYSAFFLPKADVMVVDARTADAQPVDNVPFGVVIGGWMASTMGVELAKKFETAFSSPDMTSSGFLDPLKMIADTNNPAIFDRVLAPLGAAASGGINYRQSVLNYIDDCVKLDMVMAGTQETFEVKILTSEDPWSEMQVNATSWFTVMYLREAGPVEGEIKDCKTAYQELNAQFSNTGTDFKDTVIGMYKADGGNINIAALDTAASAILNSALGGWNLMLNNYLNYAWKKSKVTGSAAEISPLTLMEYQAMAQRHAQQGAERSMFMEMMQPLSAFIEALFYFMAPFMAFLVTLGPYGIGMLSKYLMILIWINTWPVTMSVVNLYTYHAMELKTDLIQKTSQQISWLGMEQFYTTADSWIATASMLAAAVPVITLALLTGSIHAMVNMANKITGGQDHINEKLASPDIAQGANAGVSRLGHTEGFANTENGNFNYSRKHGSDNTQGQINFASSIQTGLSQQSTAMQARQQQITSSIAKKLNGGVPEQPQVDLQ